MEKTKDDAKAGSLKRPEISVVVGTLKHYDLGYECTLSDFIRLIEAVVADIPAKYRENVTVDWTDGDECDSGYIEFTLRRDATDDEIKQMLRRSGPGRYAR